jgi:hypothetical protein
MMGRHMLRCRGPKRRTCSVCRGRSSKTRSRGWLVLCESCVRAIADGVARALFERFKL